MSDLVEFRHLKYISAIAETANFTRAAERLFLAQSSLSKQIKDLEDGIAIDIFRRNRDGVNTTAAGQMIAEYAQEAIRARDEIIKAARAVHQGEVPVLRIGFSCFVSPKILQSLSDAYASLFPECPTQLSGGDPSQILRQMQNGKLDAALLPLPISGQEWQVEQIASTPLVVCMRADDPLAEWAKVQVSDVAKRLRIFRDPERHPSAHSRLMEMLAEIGIRPEISNLAATPTDIQWMVRSRYGLALIDQETPLDPDLTTRPIADLRWTADTAFVHRTEAQHLALPILVRHLQKASDSKSRKPSARPERPRAKQLELLA